VRRGQGGNSTNRCRLAALLAIKLQRGAQLIAHGLQSGDVLFEVVEVLLPGGVIFLVHVAERIAERIADNGKHELALLFDALRYVRRSIGRRRRWRGVEPRRELG
jgi:hypothetical protein